MCIVDCKGLSHLLPIYSHLSLTVTSELSTVYITVIPDFTSENLKLREVDSLKVTE